MLHRTRLGALAAALLLVAPRAALADPPRGSTDEELAIGAQVTEEIDHSVRMSSDTLMVAHLNEMARRLAPRTERPLVRYDVRLIEAPYANAFSIPGGAIYFTDQLVKESKSDDEIAGVMAHEIAHNVRQHVIQRMHRGSTKAMRLAELASLGLLIVTRGGQWGQAAQLGVSALTQSVMSANTIQDEKDADAHGLSYLIGSEYNPVGFLTFMEHEATLQNAFEEEQAGFYRDHPFSGDRVLVARRTLEEHNIPIRRRAVKAAPMALFGPAPVASAPAAADAQALAGSAAPRLAVLYQGDLLYMLGLADTSATSAQRNLAALNGILDMQAPAESARVETAPDGGARLVHGEFTLELSAADARANGLDAPALAARLRDRFAAIGEQERRRVALLYYLIGNMKEPN